jgi:hypothetical protein
VQPLQESTNTKLSLNPMLVVFRTHTLDIGNDITWRSQTPRGPASMLAVWRRVQPFMFYSFYLFIFLLLLFMLYCVLGAHVVGAPKTRQLNRGQGRFTILFRPSGNIWKYHCVRICACLGGGGEGLLIFSGIHSQTHAAGKKIYTSN